MAKIRITMWIEVSGPDAEYASEAIDDALDAGSVQDAIEDAREMKELDFTIESATITEETELETKRREHRRR